jgi:hypothetical protein
MGDAWGAVSHPDDKLVTVATFDNPFEANFAKERLASEDIEAFVLDEHAASMTGLPSVFGGIRLQVRARDEAAAARVLEAEPDPDAFRDHRDPELLREDPDVRPQDVVLCPSCGSDLVVPAPHPPGFVLISIFMLGIPLLLRKRESICHTCGHRWRPVPGGW